MASPQTKEQSDALVAAMAERGNELIRLRRGVSEYRALNESMEFEIDRLHGQIFKMKVALSVAFGFAFYFAYLLIR